MTNYNVAELHDPSKPYDNYDPIDWKTDMALLDECK
jgi:hypothetical protein